MYTCFYEDTVQQLVKEKEKKKVRVGPLGKPPIIASQPRLLVERHPQEKFYFSHTQDISITLLSAKIAHLKVKTHRKYYYYSSTTISQQEKGLVQSHVIKMKNSAMHTVFPIIGIIVNPIPFSLLCYLFTFSKSE